MRYILLCILAITAVDAEINSEHNGNPWLDSILPPTERVVQDKFFEPTHTYTYLYDGQLATGIPGASKQHSGTRIQCLAELIFLSPTSCSLQLSHIRVGRMNRVVPDPKKIMPFETFEEVPLHDDVRSKLEMPVGFTYHDGAINDVTFDGEEPPWCSNFVRGVLNMLQVTLTSDKEVPTEEMRFMNVKPTNGFHESKSKQYRIMEKTLEGECESIYTMFNVSTTENVDKLVLFKSIDFDKCRTRPQIKYNFRFADSCPACESSSKKATEEFLKPTTLAKYNVRRNAVGNWMLEKSNIESEHIFSPYDPKAGVAVSYINQTLILLKSVASTESARNLNHPVKSDWGLSYALDFDIWKERFIMDGEEDRQLHFLRRMPYSDVKQRKRELISGLIRAILSHMKSSDGRVDEEAPRHMMRLVYAFRLFTKSELDDIYREMTSHDLDPWTKEERKQIKDIFPHVVAMCATKECVAHLVQKIKDGTVQPVKAAMVIKCLVQDRCISERQIADLLSLADNEIVAQNFILRQSLWLTIGSLMNGLCTPNDDILAREYRENVNTFCTRQLKENYVDLLFNKFNAAENWADQVLFMRTIGNAGIDLSIFHLEKIIRNIDHRSYTNSIRSEAMLALRQLKQAMPRKVQKLLLPIIANRMEHPAVRVSASYQLLRTFPERAILDQLARMLVVEPNRQVASFIFTYMNTLAKSSNPCEQKFAIDLKFALRHANVQLHTNEGGYSSMNHYAFHSKTYLSGMDVEFGSMYTNTSFLPSFMKTTIHANSMGFWYKYLFALGFVQDGLGPMVSDMLLGKNGHKDDGQGSGRIRRLVTSAINEIENEINTLFTKMGIQPRRHADEDPKLLTYIKFLDQDFAILPFILTEKQRERKQADGVIDLKQLMDDLRSGISLNMNEACLLAEITHKVPTTLGMPLVWDVKIPVMYGIAGYVQVNTTSANDYGWETLNITVDLKPSIVATMMTDIEIWSPVVNSGLRITSKIKLHTPIDANIEMDRKSDPIITRFAFKLPAGKKELLSMETRPIAVTRVWPSRPLKTWNEPDTVSIMSEDVSRISQFKSCFGKGLLGVEICARGQYARAIDLKKDAPRCPLIGPEKILITTETPQGQPPVEISLKLSTKFSEMLNNSIRPTFSGWTPFIDHDDTNTDQSQNQYQVQHPIKHTANLEMQLKGRPLLNGHFIHHYDPNHLYGDIEWKFQSPAMPRFALCFKSEMLYPKAAYTIDDMRDFETKKAKSFSKLTWGDANCAGDNYVSIQMQAHQPKSHKVIHDKDPEHILFERCSERQTMANCSPIMQYEHLLKSSLLTKYQFIVEHKNAHPMLTNVSLKMLHFIKHALFSHEDFSDSKSTGIADGKVYLDVELDAKNKRRANLNIQTPNENVLFSNVPLPSFISPINVKQSRKSIKDYVSGNAHRALCHVSKRKIKTFDNVEYTVPLSTCFHILAKDCSSSQPTFVVMMRKSSDDEKKEMKILLPKHKVLVSSKDGDSIEIDINGRKYKAIPEEVQMINDHARTVIKIFAVGPYVKLEFPESKFFVYFDGYAAHIKLSRLHLHGQCGLCGHFDNEPLDEFRKANFQLEQDVRQFYKSWTTNEPSGCIVPDVDSICQDTRCTYDPYLHINGEDTKDELNGQPPQKMTRVMEIDADICFSVDPIDTCPTNMYAIQKETRPIHFVCLSRDDELSEIMLEKLRSENIVKLDKQANGVKNLDIPMKCAFLN